VSLAAMKSRIADYVKTWEDRCYPEGIPDEAPPELEAAGLVPSYRRICLAIIKNDVQLQTLGYSRVPCPIYMEIKRVEIAARHRDEQGLQTTKRTRRGKG
jgi:predicted phosphoadenosine phosphosulfate sulfurtransferase